MDKSEQAQLLKMCRQRLGMSSGEFQVELCFRSSETIRQMESGAIDIYGVTWIALMYLLDEWDHEDLADQIQKLVEDMRDDLDNKRRERRNRREHKRRQRGRGNTPIKPDAGASE